MTEAAPAELAIRTSSLGVDGLLADEFLGLRIRPAFDMPIAYCTLELYLPYSQSLKEKRMILRKAQDRLRARSHFSIAEVEYQDLWQRAKIAAVTVGADNAVLERVTQEFVKEAENILAELLIDCQVSYIDP